MGSKGRAPRKPTHSQHLPKVGSHGHDAQQREMRDEQRAVLDVLGITGASLWVKVGLLTLGVVLLVAALWTFVF
jgi:hypothetical protein